MRATSTKVQKLGFRKITFPSRAPFAPGRSARGLVCKCLPRVTDFSPSSTSAFSRAFQMSSNSFDGAVPIRPGWMRPGKRTPTHTHTHTHTHMWNSSSLQVFKEGITDPVC